jgi:23S rRNA (pseudouridine1915-N3)-methyltransferase
MAGKPQVKIIAVGKLRESFWRDADAEYRKRLTGYTTKLTLVEVADEATSEDASAAQEDIVKKKEGERILAQIGLRDYVIALDRQGKSLDSVAFASHLERVAVEGAGGALTFIIGGSLGLHDSILARADFALSFGAFTFPHQLMRVILMEQIYRAAKIQREENYHK